jgi:Uma2 family endonuclease
VRYKREGRAVRNLEAGECEMAHACHSSTGEPILWAVEILSQSSTRADRFTKRRLYQERAIPTYWMVDGDAQLVEIWQPDAELPVIERNRLTWRPAGAARPFALELSALFRPI